MSTRETAVSASTPPAPSTAGFLEDFAAMSVFGATPGGGIDRQAATPDDRAVRSWFTEQVDRHGGRVQFDEIGNQFGLFERTPGAPYVLVGSHMDSQPLAGRFDGSYGVLAGLYAVSALVDEAHPSHSGDVNLAVVNWFNEEGSRFSPSMMGSSVYTGSLDLAEALASTDHAGVTVADALAEADWTPVVAPPEIAAYAEIHVEQGRILEDTGTTIGLVSATWGARKFRVTVHGEQGHTGSTLMSDRRDALFGASLVIAAVRRMTEEVPAGSLQASVSQMVVEPNSPVTIAREVTMNLDLRSPDTDILQWAETRVAEVIAAAEDEAHVRVERELTHQWALNPYPAEGIALAGEVARDLGFSHREIYTVAGHDSTNMKEKVPTVMLFVPSVEGVSHNEAELTRDDDMLAGVEVLTEVVRRLAESVHSGGN
ncbi:M20 family metallo-hydrolase [Corynebacterium glyciniphilum]|uniref:M20 family metallo-hydrolase n=1 Tax=Corynebacterium glyciniphilum TaxID=1404244 RepID=UPI0011AB732C|nr:M20 family metallo-hydrolase [Corynebacterium glyciniphilum]